MVIKYTNTFHSKAFQIYSNWDFWLENKPSGIPVRSSSKSRLHRRELRLCRKTFYINGYTDGLVYGFQEKEMMTLKKQVVSILLAA
jgi:hypothetical protein